MRIDTLDYDIQRLVLGVILSFGLATLVAWPLAYLSSIATCILLASRKPITVKMSLAVTAIVFLSTNLIYGIFYWVGNYPILMALVVFISTYLILYKAARGGSKIITLIILMAVLIIPTSFNIEPKLAWLTTKWLTINTLVGFIVTNFCLLVMPISPKIKQIDDSIVFPPQLAHDRALELSVAILPVVIIYWLDNSVDILLLVFLTLFIHRLVECPSLRYKVTMGYLVANILGGALALIAFELLVIAPNFLLLLSLSLIVISLLSLKAFSDEKHTVLSFTAINSYIALMGATVLYNVSDGEVAYLNRLIQILIIALYLLLFFEAYNFIKYRLFKINSFIAN